jgi:hypothetical protein
MQQYYSAVLLFGVMWIKDMNAEVTYLKTISTDC